MKKKPSYLSKEDLFVDVLRQKSGSKKAIASIEGQQLLLLAWEYSRLWPEIFERYRIRSKKHLGDGASIPPSRILPKYAMSFVLSKHWPKKPYLALSLPQRIEAFPLAPCFQKKIYRQPAFRKALGNKGVLLPSPIRVLKPLSDNQLEQSFIYQAIRAPRDTSKLLLLDMTAGRHELEGELKLFFDMEFPSTFDGWKKALSALAIYKALRANWSPERAVPKNGKDKTENPYAMYFLWRKASGSPITPIPDESIVPVQESRHRIFYAKKVPKYFKEIFDCAENPIRLSRGPFLRGFK